MIQRFMHRPVLAIVLSIFIVFVGAISMKTLPISQFPEISPPRVMVTLDFPGASADVLIKSSIITLERAINGVPGMIYMTSDATSAGE
ncbi:MAG: efflux RND transporter permease subunit, partial [Myxococcales bacterium]|nr:efflux RND transporter permease subunit [Myxococcales bacterium]